MFPKVLFSVHYYSLCIYDFVNFIGSSQCDTFIFADDINLLFTGDVQFLDCHEATINYILAQASIWAQTNKLTFNSKKTKALIFGSNASTRALNIKFDGVRVQFQDSLTCLGVVLDSGLTFKNHISKVSSKVNMSLRALYNMDCFLPVAIKIRIAHSLLMTHLHYCLDVYSGTTQTNLKVLQLIYNRIIRYIFGLKWSDSVSCYSYDFF